MLQINYGTNIEVQEMNENCTMMKITDETGEGIMTSHRILDGVYLTYSDMHLSKCVSEFQLHKGAEFFCIDHCRDGRIESEIENGTYSYLQERELRIDNREHHAGKVTFPLNHYHGISIGFDIKIAQKNLKKMYGGFSVNLNELREKYCQSPMPYVIREEEGIEHILSELYQVPSKIKEDYYKIKTLELLLYLDALQISDKTTERPYFYKGQVEKIKAIHDYMVNHIQEHITLQELSNNFHISLTSMKLCFKEQYGDSIYSYLTRYRMNTAATLLMQQREMTIADIAGYVGYESPSKFTAAFHKIMGCTPIEYRTNMQLNTK